MKCSFVFLLPFSLVLLRPLSFPGLAGLDAKVSRSSSHGFGRGWELLLDVRSFVSRNSLITCGYLVLRLGLLLAAEAHDSTTKDTKGFSWSLWIAVALGSPYKVVLPEAREEGEEALPVTLRMKEATESRRKIKTARRILRKMQKRKIERSRSLMERCL